MTMPANSPISKAAWLFLFCGVNFVESFSSPPSSLSFLGFTSWGHCCKLYYHSRQHEHADIDIGDERNCNAPNRRSFLTLASASMIGLVDAAPGDAIDGDISTVPSLEKIVSGAGNFECLLDLPPVTPGCVRLYLCRHGQTENNRLNFAQGARADPSINVNGYQQAERLGLAVSTLAQSGDNRDAVPHLAVHSNLRRARETAELVSSTALSQSAASKQSFLKVYGEVPSIREIDFGSLEGRDVKEFRKEMRNTIAKWAFGDVDVRTGGGGESGREVLERAALALEQLSNMAKSSSTNSVLAVSHSGYLKTLLALVNDSPLIESGVTKIQNCSVNIVDVNVQGKKRLVTLNSGIFGVGGGLIGKLKSNDGFEIEMPESFLIRRNEVRHLQGMDA